MKAVVAHHEISASGSPLESNQARRIADAASKTLGNLVGTLLGTYVTRSEHEEAVEPDAPDNIISLKIKMSLQMSAEDYDRTQNDLKELVRLRNNLVHHFIDQHDLWNLAGCRGAQESLAAAYSRIDQYFEQLRGWAEHMDQTRRLAAEFAQSDAVINLMLKGIAPDGLVDWPTAGIVCALREAADELAVEEWTPVATAGRWIAERYPEQLPAKYGCSSWRQVIHESRLFDLRYRETNGQRAAWYRVKKI
ncbi:OST-HTH/LOTUS domain-containing protein [Methyloversatilis sp. RAC08]|uniref:OST-HTH/LOTUS domain-containing protein n=1 Tax=Methyloversatilis sp. RAC08 TaxID=1842540 RepID=UPI00083E1045|nr:OST-HTH/LOTUS domain-containing protein [Methyloversatilis sp. RAC08]